MVKHYSDMLDYAHECPCLEPALLQIESTELPPASVGFTSTYNDILPKIVYDRDLKVQKLVITLSMAVSEVGVNIVGALQTNVNQMN